MYIIDHATKHNRLCITVLDCCNVSKGTWERSMYIQTNHVKFEEKN